MPESQQDIDALLAEVNALAEEAVTTIAGGDDGLIDQPSRAAAADKPSISTGPSAGPSAPPSPATVATAAPRPRREDVSRILRIQVPVIVQLAQRTMPLADILSLTTGAIIEFDKPADCELDLMINNKCIGQGQAVKVAENFGLRVTQIGSLRERIQALGGQ